MPRSNGRKTHVDPIGNLTADLTKYTGRMGHIQFADYPGRGQPGTGELDFYGLMRTIGETGYGDWIGAEYHPQGSTAESLDWMQDSRVRDLFGI